MTGLLQLALAPASSLQLNVVPVLLDVKPNVALVALVGFAGAAVIAVSGAVVSTTHVKDAGLGSMFPAESMARTSNVCEPSESPV